MATIHTSISDRLEPKFERDLIGSLDARSASKLVAASADVAMVIDGGGVIRDVALGNKDLALQGLGSWLDRRWSDTVAPDSRQKIDDMLRDAANDAGARWREINHLLPGGASLAIRYIAINVGEDGRVIAIGRDQRAVAELQQRLVQAQQSIEREYARLREAESRYRLLFQLASEAVIVIDAATRKIVEANPAAQRLIGDASSPLIGRLFFSAFDTVSHDAAASLLTMAHGGANMTAQSQLVSGARGFSAAASLFRQDRSSLFLVRLSPIDSDRAVISESTQRLMDVLEQIPDAFVVTDDQLKIIAENSAFLDLTRLASKEQARGQPLDRFLGRPDMDRNILVSSLRQHGVLKNFATVMRNLLGEQEDVEVSAVHVAGGEEPCFGFSIRSAVRGIEPRPHMAGNLSRSVEQWSHLVGRVTLKELVRETTDLVERMCIEAALELTNNNRASAAEILGLSRQSLYTKLHRYGMGDLDAS